ncbi:hypothetical protein B0H16DRAFT_1845537 [Mycena metata]|uniref:Uncharacterized protein n=1 Tax=Mycena metata TaxID=1033252 RepID=A0AAD7ISK6_9AGAR|nr:hypothetical protein B0H16DRAFT_1845537 [Mycena metata]
MDTLPALDIWAETHLSAVVHSTNPDEVAAAFDAFWSDDVWITFNGVATSAADYHARRITQGFNVTLDIEYAASIAAPAMAGSSQAGAVALFFTNQVGGKNVTSIMNLLISPDPYVTGNGTRQSCAWVFAPRVTAASNTFFADDASIVSNGKVFSITEYNAQRVALNFTGTTTVTFSAALEVPTIANSSLAGAVALFFNVQVMGMADVASTMNLIIRPDPFASGRDTRRVYALNQVAASQIQT